MWASCLNLRPGLLPQQPEGQMAEGSSSEQAVSSLWPRVGVLELSGRPSRRRPSALGRSKLHPEKKEPTSVNAPDRIALLIMSIWPTGGAFGANPWLTAGLKWML